MSCVMFDTLYLILNHVRSELAQRYSRDSWHVAIADLLSNRHQILGINDQRARIFSVQTDDYYPSLVVG